MKTPTVSLTPAQFRQAADLQETIEVSQRALTALLSGQTVSFKGTSKATKVAASTNGKRQMTPEQKAKISAGLAKKWAEKKAAAANQVTASSLQTGEVVNVNAS